MNRTGAILSEPPTLRWGPPQTFVLTSTRLYPFPHFSPPCTSFQLWKHNNIYAHWIWSVLHSRVAPSFESGRARGKFKVHLCGPFYLCGSLQLHGTLYLHGDLSFVWPICTYIGPFTTILGIFIPVRPPQRRLCMQYGTVCQARCESRTLHSGNFDEHSERMYVVTDGCSAEWQCFNHLYSPVLGRWKIIIMIQQKRKLK